MSGNGFMQVVPFNTTDPAAIAAAESVKARIQCQYIMALQKQRDAEEARQKIIKDCKRPDFAQLVEYFKPIGGKKIPGVSIRFAETALRHWGNISVETQIVHEDEQSKRLMITCIDLETNSTFSKSISINKTVERKNGKDREVIGQRQNTNGETVYIVKATEDELLTKEGAAISKAIRNEGLRLIPKDIIEEAVETARKTLRDKMAKDPDGEKRKILDAFSSIGVKPKDLTHYLGHPIENISPLELEDLRKIHKAISDGEATWNDFFGEDDDENDVEGLNKRFTSGKKRESQNKPTTQLEPEPQQQPSRSEPKPKSTTQQFYELLEKKESIFQEKAHEAGCTIPDSLGALSDLVSEWTQDHISDDLLLQLEETPEDVANLFAIWLSKK